jgi:RNA polymerase sigma-70 factor (ECF subfamily)
LPEDVLEGVERNSVVRAAILVLPDDRREVLLCKYVEGLSVDSIAIRMGRTAKAVESLLSRSREQLREQLRWYTMPSGDGRRVSQELSNE